MSKIRPLVGAKREQTVARISRLQAVVLPLLLLACPALQIHRYAAFAATDGGIEHDSGWYLGVARNLAERGIYASSTNVALSNEAVSRGKGFHNRPTLQDEEGYTYFPAGVTVGPGFVVPEAMVLKLLGVGWWQFRLFPLTVMFCLLVLLSALAYLRGGYVAMLLLQAWLWLLPTVTFNFAYEAYSEHVALFYSLLAFCAYGLAVAGQPRRRLLWLGAGMLLGASCWTKNLYLISTAAVVLHLEWQVVRRRLERRTARIGLALIAAGFLLPVLAYEGYRFVSIVSRFGVHGWHANNADYALTFLIGGSGLGSDLADRLHQVSTKLEVLEIPTNRPVCRLDEDDEVYRTRREKHDA
ncbi:MAG: hypothetical protein HUU20_02620, partial [Pirellulales bacterium]|nr:hypothetical protein [Pirellulales bacterium]